MNQTKLESTVSDQYAETDVQNIDFAKLFNLDELQKLQDAFSEAFGIASIITRPDGTPITRPSRFSKLCSDVILKTEKGRQNCQMLNPTGSIQELKSLTSRCELCGKWEISAGICVESNLIALWRVGQVRETDTTDEQLLAYASKIDADPQAYKNNLAGVPVMSRQTLEKIANMLAETASILSRQAFQNYQLRKSAQLKENAAQVERANFLADKAFKLAKAGYWSVPFDNSGYYLSNPRTAKIFGDLPKPDWRYHITDEWLANIEAADPDAARRAIQSLNDLIEGRSTTYDVVYPYKRPVDGKVVWIHATGDLTRDENQRPLDLYGVVQDITGQILGEKALKESRERLDLALKGAWLGLWDWRPESGELATSEIWAEMLGYSAAELDALFPKTFERWQKLLHPEDMQRIWKDVQDHIDGRTATYRAEFRLKTKAGKWKWILAIGNSVEHNAEGKSTRIVGFHIDMDEQKRNEEALATAKAMAEAATVAKSNFLANMSHEIRTPMNAIIGMSQLALQTDLTHQQHNYIEKVHMAAQNLLGIINDILDFSKIEAGKMAIDQTDFWLEDVLNNFAVLTNLKAEEKSIELLFDIAPEVPLALVGDPLRLNQILTNLGNNAIKFTDSGEIVVGVEELNATDTSTELHFWIKDSGIGMDESQQEKLFMPFAQVDNSASRKSGGTGLGLVISKSLIEDMQGKIWLTSEPGRGSTFHFTARFGLQYRQKPQTSVSRLRDRNVLLIAKNNTERAILTRGIKSLTMSTDNIPDSQNVIKHIEHLRDENRLPDLVVASSDITGSNCVECALKIKNSEFAQIPVILITGAYQLAKVLHLADKLGINQLRVLSRPVFPSAFRTNILEILGLVKTSEIAGQHEKSASPMPAHGLAGARVLLVEDNEMNQELAIELLKKADISVVLARHGQEALDILKSDTHFDGILMDCQMPVMDGYQATAAIREMPHLQEIPIIAMTANAMAGDREKALAAGMKDHIAKPIDVGTMFITLSRWIKPGTARVPDQPAKAPQTQTGPKIPELAGINTRQILANLLNNTELYRRMLIGFYNDYQNFREKFIASFKSSEPAAATRYAHTLKSCAGNIGATSVQALAERLEQSCKSGNQSGAFAELVDATAAEIDVIRKELAKVVEQAPEPVAESRPRDFDQVRFAAVCGQLQNLLLESDSEAISVMEQNRETLEAAMNSHFDELAKLVRGYDFEAALSLIEKEKGKSD